ncbi:F-box/FBD/LRR-repeat protein At5g53840-like [Salvia hispanica]|uniref:F-box/FBD/LRR-repeat protein At5g53840-like n=1 Tax=Salvia hispanica TaxID=49212 RepID=UPI00200991FD|nr:F-box/FBD/LRR-repeat protein At5g53840-like [Salvia hispanica]
MQVVQDDRISELPNDILISIISRLTIREATATCVLSTCWRHLHYYVTHLNFPKYEIGETVSDYLCIVNHVLNSHKGRRIKELRVDRAEGHERWFEFALTKKAERIHIAEVGIEFHGLPNGLQCLKELSLSSIEITDQDLKLLVSNCLVLECLAIKYSTRCENVSIVGHSKLKHLNFTYLRRIRSIMIHDLISLVSLTCYELGSGCSVQLSYIPKLTKLDLRDSRNRLMHVEFLAGMPSCIRDQLKLLRLSSQYTCRYKRNHGLLNDLSLQLVNITHLQFVLDIRDDSNWHYFSSYACRLVEACGSLQKLMIKFLPSPELGWGDVKDETYDHYGCDLSLKYLEISGYSGFDSEWRLTLNLINNVTSFQKMIVVACDEEALARAHHDFRHITTASFLVTPI